MQQGVILKVCEVEPGVATLCRVAGEAYAVTVMLWPANSTV